MFNIKLNKTKMGSACGKGNDATNFDSGMKKAKKLTP